MAPLSFANDGIIVGDCEKSNLGTGACLGWAGLGRLVRRYWRPVSDYRIAETRVPTSSLGTRVLRGLEKLRAGGESDRQGAI